MSSSHIVPVTRISTVLPHPDPETTNLEVIHLEGLGWQLVAQKGQFTEGQKVVYVPPQSMMPRELSDRLSVTQYLSRGRVRSISLRGEPSFGLAFPPDQDWDVGANVAEHYGITRYTPPVQMLSEDSEPEAIGFEHYTSIEDLRNFPTVFEEGERVVVTEKLDGTNWRAAFIDGHILCGSFRTQKTRPVPLTPQEIADGKKPPARSLYWFPYEEFAPIRRLLEDYAARNIQRVILYGEIYGPGVRSLQYGVPQGAIGFALFDIWVDGAFLPWHALKSLCLDYDIATVPVVGLIPYSFEAVKRLSGGETTLNEAGHIREGVVVRPWERERTNPQTGRTILKLHSDAYLLKKSKGEVKDYTDV